MQAKEGWEEDRKLGATRTTPLKSLSQNSPKDYKTPLPASTEWKI